MPQNLEFTTIQDFTDLVMYYLPGVLAALAILIVGWLLALIIAYGVRTAVRKTKVGATLVGWLRGEEKSDASEAGRWAGIATFYLVIFFVLVAFFQSIGLTLIADPLQGFLMAIFQYAPRILGAVVLLLLAWIIASLLKMVITRVFNALKIDERLGEDIEIDEEKKGALVKTLANIVYWLVFVFFLPLILTALNLEGLLVPVQEMFRRILGYLPQILAAVVIMLAGWFGARILQRLVAKATAALGVDKLSENTGVSPVLGERKLSGLIGLLVYALVVVFAIIAALNALQLEYITAPASNMLEMILTALPALLAAALVLTVAYLLGKVLSGLAANILSAAGFDNILKKIGFTQVPPEGRRSPSEIVGMLILISVMLFASIEAANLLDFARLADLISGLIVILAQVAVGVLIFGIGLYLAGVAFEAIQAAGGPKSTLLAKLARISILVLAGFMALNQIGVAEEIIVITFGVLLGTMALTTIIAFGVGGRDLAARELENWIQHIKSKE